MVPVTREAIREELRKIKGPDFESDIVSLGLLSEIFITGSKVFFSITVPCERAQELEPLRRAAEKVVHAMDEVEEVVVTLTEEKQSPTFFQTHKNVVFSTQKRKANTLPMKIPIENVRHVVAVASGKGGVGKSTMAINIALALQEAGFKTGLMDADIYGPSLPRLTGLVNQKPQLVEGKKNSAS